MAKTTEQPETIWLSTREAARRFGVARPTFKRIAEAAGIRRQVLPGLAGLVRYDAEHVDRIARESIIPTERPRKKGAKVAR